MKARISYIAANTFREAVRDRVLYNLIAFALKPATDDLFRAAHRCQAADGIDIGCVGEVDA